MVYGLSWPDELGLLSFFLMLYYLDFGDETLNLDAKFSWAVHCWDAILFSQEQVLCFPSELGHLL